MFSVRVALGFLVMSGAAVAQQYVISTYAGGSPPTTPVAAVYASIGLPQGIATDATGSVYFSSSAKSVFKVDSGGTLTLVAGNSRVGYSGDGGLATNAQISGGVGLALDPAGNLYIADTDNNRVPKVAPAGIITTVAGTGIPAYSVDGGPATNAKLSGPTSVALDRAGNLYIADAVNLRVRKVSPAGVITTVAGNGVRGFSGDGGPASGAQLSLASTFNYASCIATDSAGNLYIADSLNDRVRMVSPEGIITTVAGTGFSGSTLSTGDGGPATSAQVPSPSGIAIDSAANLYIATYYRVRMVSRTGIITTVAGSGTQSGYSGNGSAATSAQLSQVAGLAVDSTGNLYLADCQNHFVRKVSQAGIISSFAGNGFISYSGDGGPATAAQLYSPRGVAVDDARNLYIA